MFVLDSNFIYGKNNGDNDFDNTTECQVVTFIFVTTDNGSGTSNKYVAVLVLYVCRLLQVILIIIDSSMQGMWNYKIHVALYII